MHIPGTPLLQESDSSKSELVNPGEYRVSATPVNSDVSSPAEGVGSSQPRRAYGAIILRAAITGVDQDGELDYHTEKIKSIDKRGNHLIFTTTTTAGEIRKIEVLPHELAFIP